jgi:hypothetical protein
VAPSDREVFKLCASQRHRCVRLVGGEVSVNWQVWRAKLGVSLTEGPFAVDVVRWPVWVVRRTTDCKGGVLTYLQRTHTHAMTSPPQLYKAISLKAGTWKPVA